ncbi:MAG: ral secretion pathway protein [Myxococcales bacterium]|nr:ral secretion pathway protein [Myxococcales bacterium]
MPVYSYKGFDTRGKAVSGVKDADNLRALRANLKRDGVLITEAKEASLRAAAARRAAGEAAGVSLLALINPVAAMRYWRDRETADRSAVAVLTRQMGTLLKAGVPLSESLGALVDQVEKPGLKRVLADVKTQVNEGASLGDAMGRHPKVFQDLYVNMIRAGEASGNLDAVMFRLADFLEAQNKLRSKVVSALFYPIVMTVIGAGIMTILMVSVVPKVTAIFADTGKALPWNTQMLIAISDTVSSWKGFVLLAFILVGIQLFRRWKATPRGRAAVDKLILKMWVVGPLARQIAITRFAKTLSTMLSSGVPLLRALEIVKSILGNVVLQKVIEDARASIQEGESIAAPLKRSGEFPPIVTHMIAVGERSGQLEAMLEEVAHAYDLEIDMKMGRLTTLLEPVMILLMGGSVAFVVFSILMPIMEMNEFVS